MIKLLFCLRRLPNLSQEEFQRYWREIHGPLVAKHSPATHVRRYVQSHALKDPIIDAMRAERGTPEPFDGFAELSWYDINDMLAARSSPDRNRAVKEIREDEKRFIDLSRSPLTIVKEDIFVDEV